MLNSDINFLNNIYEKKYFNNRYVAYSGIGFCCVYKGG